MSMIFLIDKIIISIDTYYIAIKSYGIFMTLKKSTKILLGRFNKVNNVFGLFFIIQHFSILFNFIDFWSNYSYFNILHVYILKLFYKFVLRFYAFIFAINIYLHLHCNYHGNYMLICYLLTQFFIIRKYVLLEYIIIYVFVTYTLYTSSS